MGKIPGLLSGISGKKEQKWNKKGTLNLVVGKYRKTKLFPLSQILQAIKKVLGGKTLQFD